MNTIRRSGYLYHLIQSERHALFHSLRLNKCYGGPELAIIYALTSDYITEKKILKAMCKELGTPDNHGRQIIQELVSLGFLIEQNADEEDILQNVRNQRLLRSPRISCLYLLTAMGCNLKCTYCCIEHTKPEGDEIPKGYMSFCVARQAVDNFLKVAVEPEYICFFGGEPLLNFAVIRKVVEYLTSLGVKTNFRINTNGALITPKIANFFAKNNFIVGVSMDGPKEIHDMYRKHIDGRGTFNEVLRGWNLLNEAGVQNMGIVSVLHSQNAERIEECVLYFLDELGAQGVNFEPVEGISNPDFHYLYPSPHQVSQALITNFLLQEQRGMLDNYISRFLNHFLSETVMAYRCASHYGVIIVDPEGNQGPCFNFLQTRHFQKHEDSEKSISHEWLKRSPLVMRQCQKCIAIGLCGGICAAHSQAINRSIWGIHPDYSCQFMKNIVEWMLWEVDRRT